MSMRHLFSAEGEAALVATMARRPLLAFDFDGTLAPIVPRPDGRPASARTIGSGAAAGDRQRPPRRRRSRPAVFHAEVHRRQPRGRGSMVAGSRLGVAA